MSHQNKPPIWLRATIDGPDLGPFRLSQVKQMAANGMVTKDFLIRQGDDAPWSSIRRAKGLFPEQRVTPIATTRAARAVEVESDSDSLDFGEESPTPSARSTATGASSDQVATDKGSPSESIDELDDFAEAPAHSKSSSETPQKPAMNAAQPMAAASARHAVAASVASAVASAHPTPSRVPVAPAWITAVSSRMALHPAASKLFLGFIALCFVVSLVCGIAVNYSKFK